MAGETSVHDRRRNGLRESWLIDAFQFTEPETIHLMRENLIKTQLRIESGLAKDAEREQEKSFSRRLQTTRAVWEIHTGETGMRPRIELGSREDILPVLPP